MSGGFLRPSFAEKLASNRSRSVGEEGERGVAYVGFLCFSFVFPLSFPLSFPFVIARSLLFYVGIPVPLSPCFLLLRLAPET